MWMALFELGAIATIGAASVPVILMLLARFGYFEPFSLTIIGRTFVFCPPEKEGGER